MRKFKIIVEPPILPKTGVEHFATSYKVSKDFRDFDSKENLLKEVIKDTTNLHNIIMELDVTDDVMLYFKTQHHFRLTTGDLAGEEKQSFWSRPVPLSKFDNRIRFSDTMVVTPDVEVTEENNVIYIRTSPFELFSGLGKQSSSSYQVVNTDNVEYFKREVDVDNLSEIYFDNNFDRGKIYIVKARHSSDSGGDSNYGSKLYPLYSPYLAQFTFEAPENFISDRKFYYRLKIWTSNFKSYTLKVVNKRTEKTVIELKNQTKLTNYIVHKYDTLNPEFLDQFDFIITCKFEDSDGEYTTDETVVLEATLGINKIYPYNPQVEYVEKFDVMDNMITQGITCSTMRETYDGMFIGVDFERNGLYLYKNNNGTLKELKQVYHFDYNLAVDYFNIIQLHNHDIIVDVMEWDATAHRVTKFIKFEYDPIKHILTKTGELIRKDEYYGTSMSNSLTCNVYNEVWYVPAYLTNGRTSERRQLKLRRLNVENMSIDLEVPLPFQAKYNVGLVSDRHGELYVFGGSIYALYKDEKNIRDDTTGTVTSEDYWTRDNRDIYVLNFPGKDRDNPYLSIYCALGDDTIPDQLYNLHAFLRVDGKIIMFNATHSGNAVNYNNFLVFTPEEKRIDVFPYNGKVEIGFRSNIVFNNGDILRISAKPQDPQNVLRYVSNTKEKEDIPDFDSIDKEGVSLTVPDKKVIAIEDIYKYKNITIVGEGALKWFRPQGITILTSKDLIVNKDMNLTQNDLTNAKYRSIIVLDGSQLKIVGPAQTTTSPNPPVTNPDQGGGTEGGGTTSPDQSNIDKQEPVAPPTTEPNTSNKQPETGKEETTQPTA